MKFSTVKQAVTHITFIRGLSVGIYLTSNSDACQYIAHDCQANIIVVENDYQMNKILTCRHELPHLKVIINCSKDGSKSEENVMNVSRLIYWEIGIYSVKDLEYSMVLHMHNIVIQIPCNCQYKCFTNVLV